MLCCNVVLWSHSRFALFEWSNAYLMCSTIWGLVLRRENMLLKRDTLIPPDRERMHMVSRWFVKIRCCKRTKKKELSGNPALCPLLLFMACHNSHRRCCVTVSNRIKSINLLLLKISSGIIPVCGGGKNNGANFRQLGTLKANYRTRGKKFPLFSLNYHYHVSFARRSVQLSCPTDSLWACLLHITLDLCWKTWKPIISFCFFFLLRGGIDRCVWLLISTMGRRDM